MRRIGREWPGMKTRRDFLLSKNLNFESPKPA